MPAQAKRIYEFGPFHLDAGERLLLRSGRPVTLPPKAFDTLVLLVESQGRLLEKDELMKSVWPDSFVEENNLNRSIYLLRKSLGESSGKEKYIETVPKHGYRFVAAVAEVDVDEPELILERRTSAEIITEEEEITDAGGPYAEETFEEATLAARTVTHAGLSSRLRRVAGLLSVVVMLMLVASVVVWWAVRQRLRAAMSARVKSIAVLPFKDMGTPGEEHLGLGLADVLITRLSNLKEVKVRPTSAVQKFEGQEEESTAVGQLLGVDAVLEGSIYRHQEQIRVTARLMRVSDQSPIWSGQFDDNAKDVLAVQNAIAEQVAESLLLNLSSGEKAAIARPYSTNADAYQLYVRGRYYWNKRSWPGMTQADYFFRRAIEKDPDFALAYLGLADTLFTSSAHPEAYSALGKALSLDPSLGEAYATMGFAQMFHEWHWQKAEESFKRAIELKPGYGTAHQWYATLLAITGRVDEGKQEMRRALEIDPLSANFLADLGQMHYFAHEYGEAESYCRKALEIAPDFIFAHQYLIDIYLKTGRQAEASEEYRKRDGSNAFDAATANAGEPIKTSTRTQPLRSAMSGFLRQRIEELGTKCTGACYVLTKFYALLGDKEQALAGLEKSYDARDFLLPFVNTDPIFDELRAEPRFQSVLHRMGFAL
ncbi:MAG TPA: winged helix-turn-helix domain-containing protein [Blastocatellia bacterium]|nr:winged helix-turn-helix domain-containing protein [Blastocatellia bacterium]